MREEKVIFKIVKSRRFHFAGILAVALAIFLTAGPLGEITAEARKGIPATVRVEGVSENIYRGEVELEPGEEGPLTALDAFMAAMDKAGIDYEIKDSQFGRYIFSVNGEEQSMFGGFEGWIYMVNNEAPPVGAADYEIKDGDDLVFYYGLFAPDTLIPAVTVSPQRPKTGEDLTVTVTSTYFDWEKEKEVTVPVEQAKVTFNGKDYFTGSDGEVSIPGPDRSGTYDLKVSKDVVNDIPALVRTGTIKIEVAAADGEDTVPVGDRTPWFYIPVVVVLLVLISLAVMRKRK